MENEFIEIDYAGIKLNIKAKLKKLDIYQAWNLRFEYFDKRHSEEIAKNNQDCLLLILLDYLKQYLISISVNHWYNDYYYDITNNYELYVEQYTIDFNEFFKTYFYSSCES